MSLEARNRLLPDWFTRIRTRQTVLPRFQRFEAWDHGRIAQMFNTILRKLPVGSSLILEIGEKEPFISRPLKGAPATGERVTEHLLDGQQRLTALWRGLHNNYEDRTYFIKFEEDADSGLPYFVTSIARQQREKESEMRPFWANRPTEQWARKLVPLDLFLPDMATYGRVRTWLGAAVTDPAEQNEVADKIAQITQQFATFNLPFLSLPATTSALTALDVFFRMNTSAAALSVYDIVVAQIEAGLGHSLHDLVAETRRKHPRIDHYYSVEDLVLYANALMQDKQPVSATYMGKEFAQQLLLDWNRFLTGVEQTIDFLEQERVFDERRLPTDVVVPALVALWAFAPEALDAEGRARNTLRKYLWLAFFTNRYEKSTNSRVLEDFRALRRLINGDATAAPPIFDQDKHPLPDESELIAAGWPVRKDRLARATLALALKQGGADLADGATATRSNLAKREYHHLFPQAYLASKGVDDDRIYRALNCALITWQTNRTMSAKEPERYLAERRDANALGDAEVKARLATHLIPFDEMVAGDYGKFLEQRASDMHAAITRLWTTGGT